VFIKTVFPWQRAVAIAIAIHLTVLPDWESSNPKMYYQSRIQIDFTTTKIQEIDLWRMTIFKVFGWKLDTRTK
jgi:hypothetical protein